MAMVEKRKIFQNEEIFWNYGVRDNDIEWLRVSKVLNK